jgi:predicted nucleic acid-binding protein
LTRYFADSYAYLAAMDGSKAYAKLVAESDLVTTHLNAVEVAQGLLRRMGDSKLEDGLQPILSQCVIPPAPVAAAAARFRHEAVAAGGNCSTVDAWGYATAQHLGIPFLTGDEHFRGVPGVKFVKA